ncbi:MAG: PAS domain S-box protein [Verrucomicrobia bacterium]|nr:PAS domain S-box protein [Verrucomicrobiota bacterium]
MNPTRILVVEDENIVAMDIERGLHHLGYTVVGRASRGEDALELAAKHRPDLVLMDIRLKGAWDGVETAEQIRRQYAIPVVFLTAYADEPTLERAKRAAPYGYLLKPFEETELHSVIEVALNQHAATRSAQAESQEALRQSEERLQQFINSVRDHALYMLDPAGNVLTWNDGAEHITGYTAAEIIGQHFAIFYPAADRQSGLPELALRTAVQQGQFDREGWRVKRDGTLFFADDTLATLRDSQGQVVGFGTVTRDISDRKRSADQLKESELRFRSIFEQAAVGVAYVTLEGRFALVNQRFADILGRTRDEVQQCSFVNLTHPDDLAADLQLTHQLLAGEINTYTLEKRYLRRDGTPIWINLTGSLVRNDDGSPRHFVAVVEEIAQRKAAEEQLRQWQSELEKRVQERTLELEVANRELESFSYSVSHDLRSPLRGISCYVRILEEDYAKVLDAEGRRLLDIVGGEAKRMGRLIDDLLAFSRLGREQMNRAVVDMNVLVQTTYHQLTHTLSTPVPNLILHPLPRALGDPAMLRQVLANLLGNALKFSQHQPDPHIEVGGSQDAGELIFYVKDNGVGFDGRFIHKLFGVFQRLHAEEEFEGTGVGLALVKRVITKHGGRVWAESQPNQGATFFFTLPQFEKSSDEQPH